MLGKWESSNPRWFYCGAWLQCMTKCLSDFCGSSSSEMSDWRLHFCSFSSFHEHAIGTQLLAVIAATDTHSAKFVIRSITRAWVDHDGFQDNLSHWSRLRTTLSAKCGIFRFAFLLCAASMWRCYSEAIAQQNGGKWVLRISYPTGRFLRICYPTVRWSCACTLTTNTGIAQNIPGIAATYRGFMCE